MILKHITPMIVNSLKSMENENLIFHVNENDFVEKVIEKSENIAILVDFWAPWCGPCKQLTPLLEEVIKEADGAVCLAKINIDENKQLATQMRIQSIPTVVAFHNKQIADGFQGVLPKTKIIKFIEKITGRPFPQNKEEFYNKIKKFINNSKFDEAIINIEEFLSENTNDPEVVSLYIQCLASLNRFEDTKNIIESLTDTLIADQKIQKAINNYKMLESASKEPATEILLSNYNEQPDNIENLLILCDKYFFEKQYEKTFDLLIENYSKSKDNKKEKIKKALLKYFESLGNTHEQTIVYRRKLSSLLFS